MDDTSLTSRTGAEEGFQTNEVNVPKENFIFSFPHKEAVLGGSMLLQEGFGSLLELLWADFL